MSKKTKLLQRIEFLEVRLAQAEVMAGIRSFEQVFMEQVEKEFRPYIEHMCTNEARFQGDPLLGWDDLKQDVLMYIYRYNLESARKRWAEGEIWWPYIKRSIANCFVNLRKSRKNWHKRLELHNYDVTDNPYQADQSNYQRPEGEDGIEYAEYCQEIMAMLDEEEQMVFTEMLEPSKGFSNYIRDNIEKGGEARATRKMVSAYFDLSYSRTLSMFKKFRGAIDFCNATT